VIEMDWIAIVLYVLVVLLFTREIWIEREIVKSFEKDRRKNFYKLVRKLYVLRVHKNFMLAAILLLPKYNYYLISILILNELFITRVYHHYLKNLQPKR
jgi:hypothetical protein